MVRAELWKRNKVEDQELTIGNKVSYKARKTKLAPGSKRKVGG